MPAPDELPLTGDALLEAVNDAMIALHERYYHREPATARTQLLDDHILACVMGGVYTDVEKTLIELQRNLDVKATRSAFQHAMKDRFIAEVERLRAAGRRVHLRQPRRTRPADRALHPRAGRRHRRRSVIG